MSQTFGEEIITFVHRIESLALVYPVMLNQVSQLRTRIAKDLIALVERDALSVTDIDTETRNVTMPIQKVAPFREVASKNNRMHTALSVIPQSFIVSLVSQYDIYFGNLVRCIYGAKPGVFCGSKRAISAGDIFEHNDIERLRRDVVEDEISTHLRESHIDQIEWLTKLIGVSTLRATPIWSSFIEVTQRRNLFVHCDGVVSRQYLDVCMSNGVANTNTLACGAKLAVDNDYMRSSYKAVFQFGVMLGHVVWHKLLPEESEANITVLNNTCLSLMSNGIYDLAKALLEFGLHDMMKADGRMKTVLQVNLAQAHKWLGDKDGFHKVMRQIDWSAQRDEFRLCQAVLEDKFSRAGHLMRQIHGSDSAIPDFGYITWPIFKEFRKSDEFTRVFTELFGDNYEFEEKRDSSLLEIDSPKHIELPKADELLAEDNGEQAS
jgi:hypothetical protein